MCIATGGIQAHTSQDVHGVDTVTHDDAKMCQDTDTRRTYDRVDERWRAWVCRVRCLGISGGQLRCFMCCDELSVLCLIFMIAKDKDSDEKQATMTKKVGYVYVHQRAGGDGTMRGMLALKLWCRQQLIPIQQVVHTLGHHF